MLRLPAGTMRWQQSLRKMPPNFAGPRYWIQQEAAHAAIALRSMFVRDIVLPNMGLLGPLVYLIEVAIGVSLVLGPLFRLGALLGASMGINLWLGLYSAHGEWPWTYMVQVINQLLFVIDPPGCALGADMLVRRWVGGVWGGGGAIVLG